MNSKFFSTKNITVAAVLTAISFFLYMVVKFPLPFFPAFLDIQFSDMPALIGGFMMGPIWGCVIILLKCLLKMPFSSTMCVGEIADILIGIAFVATSSLIYKKLHSKKGALISLSIGSLAAVVMSLLANAFILIPFYANVYGWNALIGMMSALFPLISQKSFMMFYLPLSILPFNLLRCLICSIVTFLLYKSLHKFIDNMFADKRKNSQPKENKKL